jgi:hypothetical protein
MKNCDKCIDCKFIFYSPGEDSFYSQKKEPCGSCIENSNFKPRQDTEKSKRKVNQ